jgi:hypothetical protein
MLAASPSDFNNALPARSTVFDEFSDPHLTTRGLGLRLTLPMRQVRRSDLSEISYVHLKTSMESIFVVALGFQANPWKDTLREGISGRVVLFLYRFNGSAKGPSPLLFCRIRHLFHVVPNEEVSKWPRTTFYIRGPARKKKKRLINDIRQIGEQRYGYRVTRRLKEGEWFDATIGNIAAFVLQSPESSTTLFVSCGIQVDSAFCHAEAIEGTPVAGFIQQLWRETDQFEASPMQPCEKIHARCGPIYECRRTLSGNLLLTLFLKCEEGIDTDTVQMYMKLSN